MEKQKLSFAKSHAPLKQVITTGKAAWISYNPRAMKDGTAFPDLLREAPKGGG